MEYKVIKSVDEKYFEKLVATERGHHFIQAMIKPDNTQTSIQNNGEIE